MSRKLLVVLPYHAGDIELALSLLEWIKELGGCEGNAIMPVADCKEKDSMIALVAERAAECGFARIVGPVKTLFSLPNEAWPRGANWMFETAIRHIEENQLGPFLWLEPDCVPMREGWLRDIENAYFKCGKTFFGHVIVTNGEKGLPPRMLSGVAVYPGFSASLLLKHTAGSKKVAWDVKMAGDVVPKTLATNLIWNLWGEEQALPPHFVEALAPGMPRNYVPLSRIPRQTALYHRCKDGSLIELLRAKRQPVTIASVIADYRREKQEPLKTGGELKARTTTRGSLPPVVHCVERHAQGSVADEERILRAFWSWERIYRTGAMIPAHVWEHDYPRNAKVIGDKRALPYLKDILQAGMKRATSPEQIVCITNDDTVLHPGVAGAVREKMEKCEACSSFRLNFASPIEQMHKLDPAALAASHKPDLGRDLFAFRKGWLSENWDRIPDFLLGELEWDLVLMAMVRMAAGAAVNTQNRGAPDPKCELPLGYVLHQTHDRKWLSPETKDSPAKLHNRALAEKFYMDNGLPRLVAVEKES